MHMERVRLSDWLQYSEFHKCVILNSEEAAE